MDNVLFLVQTITNLNLKYETKTMLVCLYSCLCLKYFQSGKLIFLCFDKIDLINHRKLQGEFD